MGVAKVESNFKNRVRKNFGNPAFPQLEQELPPQQVNGLGSDPLYPSVTTLASGAAPEEGPRPIAFKARLGQADFSNAPEELAPSMVDKRHRLTFELAARHFTTSASQPEAPTIPVANQSGPANNHGTFADGRHQRNHRGASTD